MVIRSGELVAVNLAAFIGAKTRSRQAIPCEVLDVKADRLSIRTRIPYRVFSMWIDREWIDDKVLSTEVIRG